MKNDFLNIYNNLVNLTRNKNHYLNLKNNDTFSDRLIILLFHFGFFLKIYKNELSKLEAQDLFDYFIKQIELSIREIGYGDVSVNKKMKNFVNLFYLIVEEIEKIDLNDNKNILNLLKRYLNTNKSLDFYVEYFNKYRIFLTKNTLNNFTKDILNLNF